MAFGEKLGAGLGGLKGWVVCYFDKVGWAVFVMVRTVGWGMVRDQELSISRYVEEKVVRKSCSAYFDILLSRDVGLLGV